MTVEIIGFSLYATFIITFSNNLIQNFFAGKTLLVQVIVCFIFNLFLDDSKRVITVLEAVLQIPALGESDIGASL